MGYFICKFIAGYLTIGFCFMLPSIFPDIFDKSKPLWKTIAIGLANLLFWPIILLIYLVTIIIAIRK